MNPSRRSSDELSDNYDIPVIHIDRVKSAVPSLADGMIVNQNDQCASIDPTETSSDDSSVRNNDTCVSLNETFETNDSTKETGESVIVSLYETEEVGKEDSSNERIIPDSGQLLNDSEDNCSDEPINEKPEEENSKMLSEENAFENNGINRNQRDSVSTADSFDLQAIEPPKNEAKKTEEFNSMQIIDI